MSIVDIITSFTNQRGCVDSVDCLTEYDVVALILQWVFSGLLSRLLLRNIPEDIRCSKDQKLHSLRQMTLSVTESLMVSISHRTVNIIHNILIFNNTNLYC